MFGGSYGSQHENALEKSLDDLLEEKTKEQIKHKNKDKDKKKFPQIQTGQFRWSQAAIMVDFALEQLGQAVRQWQFWSEHKTEQEK